MLLLLFAGVAQAIDCPQQLTREDIGVQLDAAEEAYVAFDTEGFRDRMNELNGLLLPCIGDLLPPEPTARVHRLQAVQQLELGNPDAASASWSAAPRIDPSLVLPDDWLPADHPLRSVVVDEGRTRRVPEPRAGHLAFDGTPGRDRPRDTPTLVQRFDPSGIALSTTYLAADDPLPPYDAIPRRRRSLAAAAGGTAFAGLTVLGASWLQYRALLAAAADPTTPATDLDRRRAGANATYGAGAGLLIGGVGLGVSAVLVGPR